MKKGQSCNRLHLVTLRWGLLLASACWGSNAEVYASEAKKRQPIVHTMSSAGMKLQVRELLTGQGIIWSMAFLPENKVSGKVSTKTANQSSRSGSILFTERSGKLKVFDPEQGKVWVVAGSPKVHAARQGGLLDVALAHDFSSSRTLFLTYAKAVKTKSARRAFTTALAQAELSAGPPYKLSGLKDLYLAKPPTSNTHHYGSRLVITEKAIYMTVGDRGERDVVQDLGNSYGKVLRLTHAGKAHPDNPFVGKKGALPEIYTYGHRNPQGLALRPGSQQIWEQEHGPRGGDEINLIKAGSNYGWPVITYGREYWGPKIGEGQRKKGMQQPVYQYTPSIAPSGFTWVAGKNLPGWSGDLLSGALKLTHLNRLDIEGDRVVKEERLLEELSERIRDVRQGPDGWVYVSTDSGRILRIEQR